MPWHGNLPEKATHASNTLTQRRRPARLLFFPVDNLAAVPATLPDRPKGHRRETERRRRQLLLTRPAYAGHRCNGSRTLSAQRFQGLFHSLSKVLFIFRSLYLFAIGLGAIFSLRRSTPAILHSTLKLCYSWNLQDSCRARADGHGTIALDGRTFKNASSGCNGYPSVLALQFHGFRFLPPRIQA